MSAPLVIRAQPGPQEMALASAADIVIYGGAAGGGKSWALLLSVVQNDHRAQFAAEIFRRTYPELTMTGGLWTESSKVFPHRGAVPNISNLRWAFPSGASVKFSHMQHEDDRFNWKGAQIPMIGFDQLESFSENQFWYMLSRNRDPSGTIPPWIFATCNPVPHDDVTGGWLNRLIAWWIDQETGYPIEDRSGVTRWLARAEDSDVVIWGASRDEVVRENPKAVPRSLVFIRSRLEDNPALLAADPKYPSTIALMPLVERQRLGGNWNVKAEAGKVFNRAWFDIVRAAPRDAVRIRAWDKASTEGGGDYSAGVRMAKAGGIYYVEDVAHGQWSSLQRNVIMKQITETDGIEVEVWVEREGGSGGKESAEISIRELAGYTIRADSVTGDKVTRAGPLSAQAEAHNVKLVAGEWNETFLRELHGFPDGAHDDQVDAASLAFNKLALKPSPMRISSGDEATPAKKVMVRA